jgi:hypothetical protein
MLEQSSAPTPALHHLNAPNSRAGWLNADEAAQYVGVHPRTLLRWARTGAVLGHKLSGTARVTWRFLIEDLDACMLDSPTVLAQRKEIVQ